MLSNDLPKTKKSLKTFILEEDAKVMDKTAIKIAITASFIAISTIANTQDANAKGHKNHTNHQNLLNAPNNAGTGIHAGTNPMPEEINEISDKSVETWHSNHYDHQDGGGGNFIEKIFGGGDDDDHHPELGSPHHIPEDILRLLKEEEK